MTTSESWDVHTMALPDIISIIIDNKKILWLLKSVFSLCSRWTGFAMKILMCSWQELESSDLISGTKRWFVNTVFVILVTLTIGNILID